MNAPPKRTNGVVVGEPGATVGGLGRWLLVAGVVIATSVGAAPMMVMSFGVFLKPVTQSFGWDRSALSAALSIAVLGNALATPTLGWLLDRFGVRSVTLYAIVLFSLSLALLGAMVDSRIIVFALFALLGVFSAGHAQVPYVTAISKAFDANRGLALGIGMSGLGVGTALVPLLAALLIKYFGWRLAYVGLGAVTFAIAFPAVALLVRVPRVRADSTGLGVTQQAVQKGPAQTSFPWRSRAFLLISGSVLLISLGLNGALSQLVPILTDAGLTPLRAASIAGMAGIATIFGKVLSGYLADRFSPHLVTAIFFALPLVGFSALIFGWILQFPVLAMASLGLTVGGEVSLAGTLVARHFGIARFGEIFGVTAVAWAIGVGLSPLIMNLCFDLLGSYHAILIVLAAGIAVSALMVAALPETAGDDTAVSPTGATAEMGRETP